MNDERFLKDWLRDTTDDTPGPAGQRRSGPGPRPRDPTAEPLVALAARAPRSAPADR